MLVEKISGPVIMISEGDCELVLANCKPLKRRLDHIFSGPLRRSNADVGWEECRWTSSLPVHESGSMRGSLYWGSSVRWRWRFVEESWLRDSITVLRHVWSLHGVQWEDIRSGQCVMIKGWVWIEPPKSWEASTVAGGGRLEKSEEAEHSWWDLERREAEAAKRLVVDMGGLLISEMTWFIGWDPPEQALLQGFAGLLLEVAKRWSSPLHDLTA